MGIAVAAAAPLEDTAEVVAARAEFQALFDAAAAGEHAALAPVNNDVQADQIADEFLADAAAKAEFAAAFESAAAGGLAALQAPAPVHEIPEVEPLAAPAPVAAPVYTLPAALPYYAYNHVLPAAPYLAGYPYHGLAYNGLPILVQ